MRITTWNLRAGGGKRIDAIAHALLEENADVLALTEFRLRSSQRLLDLLHAAGFVALSTQPPGAHNGVCVLAQSPLEPLALHPLPKAVHRWLPVHLIRHGLNVLAVHVPNRGEVWDKANMWARIEDFAARNAAERSLIVGDLNTALDEDCQGAKIQEAVHLKRLLDAGWTDAWRQCNPSQFEFTWFSHRQNGFRLDHCLVSPKLATLVQSATLNHRVRESGLSDHAMLTVDLALVDDSRY